MIHTSRREGSRERSGRPGGALPEKGVLAARNSTTQIWNIRSINELYSATVMCLDFVHPVEAVIPGAQGRVLAVLAETTAELNLRTVARLAGVSVAQVSRVMPISSGSA